MKFILIICSIIPHISNYIIANEIVIFWMIWYPVTQARNPGEVTAQTGSALYQSKREGGG